MTEKKFHQIRLREIRKGNLIILDKLRRREKPITLDIIIKYTSVRMGVNPNILNSNTRKAEIVRTRQIIYSLAYQYLDISYAELGWQIGRKDHTTVIHSIKTIKNLTETDKFFRKQYEQIQNDVLNER